MCYLLTVSTIISSQKPIHYCYTTDASVLHDHSQEIRTAIKFTLPSHVRPRVNGGVKQFCRPSKLHDFAAGLASV